MPSITDRKALKKSILRAARDSPSAHRHAQDLAGSQLALSHAQAMDQARGSGLEAQVGVCADLTINLYKTELCVHWTEFGACPYGKMCQYAHGQSDLHDPLPFDNSHLQA